MKTVSLVVGGAAGRRRVPQAAQNASVAEVLAAQLGQLLGTVVLGGRGIEKSSVQIMPRHCPSDRRLAQTPADPMILPVNSGEVASPHTPSPWRVCTTRDEPSSGPLAEALRAQGFIAVACPVALEAPADDPAPLIRAAASLEQYSWLICASARSVAALRKARTPPWPRGLRTAAVGDATAKALLAAGADPAPLVGDEGGADALWGTLVDAEQWPGRRVLIPTTPGGRRLLIDRLTEAGAVVEAVEAYRMQNLAPQTLSEVWHDAAPNAAVFASPSAAEAVVEAVGAPALTSLHAVVAIGRTTAEALSRHGVPCLVSGHTDFKEVARTLAAHRAAELRP
jgi:uroporphyrinogen-III synthase